MARPIKPRWISSRPPGVFFMPRPMVLPPPSVDASILTIDELEALRLADLNGLSQEAAARSMNVSRATFGRIVARARKKAAYALVHGKGIGIEGGVVQFLPPRGRHGHGRGPMR